MCGNSCYRGGSDARKALVPESRGAGTGAKLVVDWPREAPAGRDRRGFPMSGTVVGEPGGRAPMGRPD